MKLKDYIIVVLVLILALVLSHERNSSAAGSFANVIPMDGTQGGFRFFDTASGKIYSYDASLQKVLRVVQLEELGAPGKEIVKPDSEADLKYTNPREEK